MKRTTDTYKYQDWQRSFHMSHAVAFGIPEALLLNQIHLYINGKSKRPEENQKYYHNDRYWTFNSCADWLWQLPCYKNVKTIQRALSHLEQLGVIITDNFNDKKYERTKWYTIDYDVLQRYEDDFKESEYWKNECKNDKTLTTNCREVLGQNVLMEKDTDGQAIPKEQYTKYNNNTELNNINISSVSIESNESINKEKGLNMLDKGNFSEEKSVTPAAEQSAVKPVLVPKNALLKDKVSVICNKYGYKHHVDNITRDIEYYMDIYRKINADEPHPTLTPTKLCDVVNGLAKNSEYLDFDIMKNVIDQHFKTTYKGSCDYNILHFVSGDVILHRVQEVYDDYSFN